MFFLTVIAIIGTMSFWYFLGLLGSCIGFIKYYGGIWEKGWKKNPRFGFKMALGGLINLVGTLLPKED